MERLDSAEVPVPGFASTPIPVDRGTGFFGRTNGGMQGRGMEYFPSYDVWSERGEPSFDFYTVRVPKDRQFRVHVIGGETRTRELIPDDEVNRETERIWNYGNGFTFRVPDNVPHPVVPMAFAAVKALWLEFGAVDIVWDGTHAYVLEVNTAPGLCDPMLEWYAHKLNSQYLHIEDIPGWDEAERRDED